MWALSILLLAAVRPEVAVGQSNKAIYCYFRSRPGSFDVEDIDPNLCTHLTFAYAEVDTTTGAVEVVNPYNELEENGGRGAFRRFTNLKQKNPNLKTLLMMGGTAPQYSIMAASPAMTEVFVQSILKLTLTYGFDGLDLDWEFPNSGDIPHYLNLVRELSEAFKPRKMILAAAVCATKECVDDNYNPIAMAKYLDFINVMTYDLRGFSNPYTSHHSALQSLRVENNPFYPGITRNSNFSMTYWIEKGVAPEQLLMGIPTYGYMFILKDPEVNGFYAPADQGAIWGYNEYCEKWNAQKANWTIVRDTRAVSPYAYNKDEWFCFDDATSVRIKSQYILDKGLGGAMVWSIGSEDNKGHCTGKTFPILRALNAILK